ncbi:MAG: aldo/keto reductase [Clostridia bacterium]|nr:aldo/keto reductase [Clostridia bacterium]
MNYRTDKYGNQLSQLGFGCMRFSSSMGKIDFEKAEKEIMTAYHNGVNYFDTAYIYPGSEVLLGKVFEKNNIRDKVNIATKLPHYLIKTREGLDRLFDEELKRLRSDYVDYYLMHMLTDISAWNRLCDMGIKEWIAEKKKSGQIRQVGFSYHGNSEVFCQLVDAYDWDFCMIQYNYMDEHTQAGKRGLLYANKKGLPVFIMEPLRGGRLVNNLPTAARKIFADYKKQYSPAAWAFRWLWNQKEVTLVLSGMNSTDMVMENIKTASDANVGDLSSDDQAMLNSVVDAINSKIKVGCTGCGYCTPCPKMVDIPGTFAAYNRLYTDGKYTALKEYVMCTALRKNSTAASNCIQCGKCEAHCPQGIDIRNKLKDAQKELEGPLYRIARKISSLFVHF